MAAPKKKAKVASSATRRKGEKKTVTKKRVKKVLRKTVKKAVKIKTRVKLKKSKKKITKRVVRRSASKTKTRTKSRPLHLKRVWGNPVMSPTQNSYWESEGVFNPGAVLHNGRVHLFYRALGPDGISRIGYASSQDGVNFDKRHPHPVYIPQIKAKKHHPYTSPLPLEYDRVLYASGGGWGGGEDPRAVKIGDRIYLTMNMFNDWHSIRVGVTSISENDLERGYWKWSDLIHLSPVNERHKNWLLFPEKINGKFAVLHSVSPDARVAYVDELEDLDEGRAYIESSRSEYKTHANYTWESWIRGAGPPPVRTKYGWLIFYHAMDKSDPDRYKLGVMLLDLKDPNKIIYRSNYPILEPDEWYENDWKPGIIYASGAIVKGNTLFIYYGGGDKHVGVAYTNLDDFIRKLRNNQHAVFSKKSTLVE